MMRNFLVAGLVLLLTGVSAQANTIFLQGVDYPGVTATANFVYTDINATSGQISIGLDNTSLINAVLTAFAFNASSDITGASLLSAPNSDWKIDFAPDSINTPGQFGLFDIGAITGPNFNGGSPNYGIATGNSGSFLIGVTGIGLDSLTADSFLDLLSDLGKSGQDSVQNFIARAQAIGSNGGSDVLIPTGGPNPVPEPTTMLLFGTGLAGLAGVGRRKMKK